MIRVCTVLYSVYLIMLDDDRTGFIESELSDTTTPLVCQCSCRNSAVLSRNKTSAS